MPVQNLQPGNVMVVNPGQITRSSNVYRTGQGYPNPGHVGWLPNGGVLQDVALAVGETTRFAINGAAGAIANGCPSMVQVLWDNSVNQTAPKILEGSASKMLETARARFAAAADGSLQQAMETLNAQWYVALCSALNLDPSTFQLVQGNMVVGTLSETLWTIFDAVPPLSVNNLFNPSQFNSFSSNYGAIINNLNQPGANQFQNDMGDYYADWSTFLNTQTQLPTGGLMALFNNWSQLHMPAGQAMQCYTDLAAIYQGPVYAAISTWLAAGGSGGTTAKAYSITVEQVTTKIAQAAPGNVAMDSETQSSDVSNSWAKGEVGGWFDIFGGEGSASSSQLSMDLISAGLSITAKFTHVATMSAQPLSAPSQDPILSQYKPWYDASALNLAYQNDNNVVWKNSPPTWDNEFGANGSLLRVCSGLIIVDGLDISIKSSASFSASDQKEFNSEAAGGFWPFFEASASGGFSNNFSFDDEGKMTYTSQSPVGNPTILGIIVTPIAAATLLTPST